jgi:CelD/BcsL family acetyltransferase involved in cellulose biosynthesis
MGDPVGQYGDALVDSEVPGRDTLLRDALAFLTRESKADLLWLRRVRTDSDIASILHAGMGQIVERQRAPYMTLTSAKDFASFEQRYSNKARKNRKRHARRLQEKGNIEFVSARRGEEAQRLASEAIDLKAKWLADRRLISSAVTDERMKLLLADLAEASIRPAGTIVSALIVDGKTAASEVSFTCKNQLFMHMIAFNLVFEKCGAGGLLLEQSLRDGYAEGLAVYDMLAPGDPYKFDWCDEAHDVTDWAIPATLKGWIYAHAYLAYMRGKLKTAMKSLPEPLRRLMQASAVRKPVSIDDVADEPR